MTFWNRFIGECERKGIKPNPAAEEMNISSATLTKWKNGSAPSTALLNKVAHYFGVSVEYLLGNTEKRTPLDKSLDDIDFALSSEIFDLSDEEKQDFLEYLRFKRKQRENKKK